MSYVMNLRKKIGKDTIEMPCACVLIINDKNEVLLEHRTDNKLWGYTGGSIEIDEAVEEAAKREIKEETNLDITDLKLFKIYSGKFFHYTYPNGDDVSPIDIVFITHNYKGTIKPQKEEVSELKWVSEKEYKTLPMNDKTIIVLEDLFKFIKGHK